MSLLDDLERLKAVQGSGLLAVAGINALGRRQRLQRVVDGARALLRCDAVQLNVLDAEQQHIVAETPDDLHSDGGPARDAGCALVVTSERLLAVYDTTAHPVMGAKAWSAQWHGYLGAPITFDGQVIGALCALTHEPRAWTTDEQSYLESLSRISSLAATEEST